MGASNLPGAAVKVLVGSTNQVKIEATREAFAKFFGDVEVQGIEVDSKVPKQPIDDDTFTGAHNRALELKKINDSKRLGADFFVGIEGGITKRHSRWFDFGAVCIIDRKGRVGFGTSSHFELPKSVIDRIMEGNELGDVMDAVVGEKDVKRKQGAVGFFTKNVIDRKALCMHGVILALAPFVNEEIYF